MDSAEVTALTSAFDPAQLLDTFALFAPYIVGVLAVIIGVTLIKWGIRVVRRKLSGGVA